MIPYITKKYKNAIWKAGLFRNAFKKACLTGDQPWIHARNARKTVLKYGPPYIFIDPTNICNLKCPMCPTGLGILKTEKGFLDPDVLLKLLKDLQHTPVQFGLWLAGEPLLHPQIDTLVAMCTQHGTPPTIYTNATRLSSELSEKIIHAGLRECTFSFYGRSIEEFETLRKGANYEKVVENIRSFLKIKQQHGSKYPLVTVQNIEPYEEGRHHRLPLHEKTDQIHKQFEGLPVDNYRTLLAHSFGGILDDNKYVAPSRLVGKPWACEVPYRDLTLNWKGEAVTCCGDLDDALILGDIKKENLYELWNNRNFQNFRAAMHNRKIEHYPLCKTCERIWVDTPHPLDYALRLEILRYRLHF